MRAFEAISTELNRAKDINDAEALHGYANELDGLNSLQAQALACDARGWALYLTRDYMEALEQYHQALLLYEELGDRKGVASANGNLGTIYCGIAEYQKALEYQHRSLALYEELGDLKGMAANLGNLGISHRDTGDYPKALEYYHRALALHKERGDRAGEATVTGNIGNFHRVTGDYPKALECLHRALAMNEEVGDRLGVAINTGNIGMIHDITGDHSAALEYYRRALPLYKEIGDRSGVARVTNNIGSVYVTTGDYSSALQHFQQACALHREMGELQDAAGVTGNIVGMYLVMGLDAEAKALLDEMDTIRIDDPGARIERDLHRATLQERSGDNDSAVSTLQRTLNESILHGLRSETADVHKALRDLALKRSDLEGYVEHNNEYTRITEEINGKETAALLAKQSKQREIDAREKEHEKHLAILHSALPKHIADRVARGETVNDHYDNAAVIFLDIVGFTTISDRIPSGHVVHLLEQIFTTLDAVCEQHDVVKIKTIGDSYMAVSFESVVNAATCALEMMSALDTLEITMPPSLGDTSWTKDVGDIKVRIGMHCGPVTAGVIGTARMQYDVWGDTVNVASRMESSGEPGRIHVSEALAHFLTPSLSDSWTLVQRGEISIKGKGSMTTYWLESTSA